MFLRAPFSPGIVFQYALLQISIWWLFHTTALLWKIRFPFHARSVEVSRHKIRHIHIACVVVAMVLPLVPVIAAMADFSVQVKTDARLMSMNATFLKSGLGYNAVQFPPVFCGGTNSDVLYYTTIFPINVIVIVGISQLIFIFWVIHKNHGLFRTKKQSHPMKFGAPERKILFTLSYYVLMTVFSLTRFTLIVRNSEAVMTQLIGYFSCEAQGVNPACDRNNFRQLTFPFMSAISQALIALFPAVNLVYAVNVKELKDKFGCGRTGKVKTKSTTSMNVSSSNM